MDSIKWKCKNWIAYFKKFENFHIIHLNVEKLDVFSFHPIFCYCYHWFHFYLRDINTFFKKYTSKVEILQRRKTRLWNIFNISYFFKMLAKANKIKLSEEFMVMWREEQSPEVFCKKSVLRNFAKFAGKHFYDRVSFLIKLQALRNL